VRIQHVTDNLHVGGVQSVVVNLANIQASRGHTVAVAAGPGPMWGELDLEVGRFSTRSGRLLRARSTARLVRVLLQSWDIVHTHQRGVSSLAWLSKRLFRFRHVEHVHSFFLPVSRPRVSFRGDALIACGSAVGEMLRSEYNRPPSRVHVVLNGVPDHGVRSRTAPRSGHIRRVVNIGRVVHEKDPERFVRIVRAVRRSGLDVHAVWVGAGDLLMDTLHFVEDSGLGNVVDFRGPVRPATDTLQDADVYLSTSRSEGLPLALIEAAAAGLPLVATDVGSVRDVVRNGVNGYLEDATATDEEIAEILAELMHLDVTLGQLGARSRQIFEEQFSLERFAANVEQVYAATSRKL
jgi:glycosyltransferase involved in cell wall biosynthesis